MGLNAFESRLARIRAGQPARVLDLLAGCGDITTTGHNALAAKLDLAKQSEQLFLSSAGHPFKAFACVGPRHYARQTSTPKPVTKIHAHAYGMRSRPKMESWASSEASLLSACRKHTKHAVQSIIRCYFVPIHAPLRYNLHSLR